jgi:hypothetical protein
MVHRGSGVDERILAYPRRSLDNRTGGELHTFTQHNISGDDGGRMNHLGKAVSGSAESCKQLSPRSHGADRSKAIHKLHFGRRVFINHGVRPQYGNSHNAGAMPLRIRTDHPEDGAPAQEERIQKNARMAASPENQ